MMDIEASLVGIGTKKRVDCNVCAIPPLLMAQKQGIKARFIPDPAFGTRGIIEDSGLSAIIQ